jgi:putative two-component system response regulator
MLLTPPFTTSVPPGTASDSLTNSLCIPMEKGLKDDSLKSAKILIIDDESLIIHVVSRFLQSNGFENLYGETDPRKVGLRLAEIKPDIVLLDIMMPFVDGLEVLRVIKSHTREPYLPVIILSATTDAETKRQALSLGANEFLSKPVDPNDLIPRVQNALLVRAHYNYMANQQAALESLVAQRTAELRRSREQIIQALAKAAEYRDNDTGYHVIRVGKITALLAAELGFDATYCRQIELASQLHDVGKIGIPDAILLNPKRLSTEEFEIMKQHCRIGNQIVDRLVDKKMPTDEFWKTPQSPEEAAQDYDPDAILLRLAANITCSHHEKWNGSGYPNGLRGRQIPVEGRITAVADVFDALTSKRPYKDSFSDAESIEIILSESEKAFDPDVVQAFLRRLDDVCGIRQQFADSHKRKLTPRKL